MQSRVLARRLSNSIESSFCIEAAEEAIARFGAPTIFNTDQGNQCRLKAVPFNDLRQCQP